MSDTCIVRLNREQIKGMLGFLEQENHHGTDGECHLCQVVDKLENAMKPKIALPVPSDVTFESVKWAMELASENKFGRITDLMISKTYAAHQEELQEILKGTGILVYVDLSVPDNAWTLVCREGNVESGMP